MFPLVHYYVNKQVHKMLTGSNAIPRHTALGGMWPDLAAAAGCDRNTAHAMGHIFYQWCMQHAPHGRNLARGIISHCSEPRCVDFYADEYCPGYHKGWCFKTGAHYLKEVAEATKLPPRAIWWKSHNFAEMSYELLTDEAFPELKTELLVLLQDEQTLQEVAEILSAYTGKDIQSIMHAYRNAPQTFALQPLNEEELAYKQHLSFIKRFDHHGADVEKMAALLRRMKAELQPTWASFMQVLTKGSAKVLKNY